MSAAHKNLLCRATENEKGKTSQHGQSAMLRQFAGRTHSQAHFSHSRETVNDLGSGSAGLMNVLASHVLPDNRSVAQFAAFRPQVDALAETAAVGN